jgi:uncharacterized membrane protein YozB (DUF420 family)
MTFLFKISLARDVASYVTVCLAAGKKRQITLDSAAEKRYFSFRRNNTMQLNDMLPFLIPLAVAELILLFVTLRHILTHKTYKRGTRTLWLIVVIVGMEFIGPILYFLLGKED